MHAKTSFIDSKVTKLKVTFTWVLFPLFAPFRQKQTRHGFGNHQMHSRTNNSCLGVRFSLFHGSLRRVPPERDRHPSAVGGAGQGHVQRRCRV